MSRPFRALGVWLPPQQAGVDAFAAALSEKLNLARYAHRMLAAETGFETEEAPDLSVVAFRYLPGSGSAEAFNELLAAHLRREGTVFITTTRVGERVMLRAAIGSVPTHRSHRRSGLLRRERRQASDRSASAYPVDAPTVDRRLPTRCRSGSDSFCPWPSDSSRTY